MHERSSLHQCQALSPSWKKGPREQGLVWTIINFYCILSVGTVSIKRRYFDSSITLNTFKIILRQATFQKAKKQWKTSMTKLKDPWFLWVFHSNYSKAYETYLGKIKCTCEKNLISFSSARRKEPAVTLGYRLNTSFIHPANTHEYPLTDSHLQDRIPVLKLLMVR